MEKMLNSLKVADSPRMSRNGLRKDSSPINSDTSFSFLTNKISSTPIRGDNFMSTPIKPHVLTTRRYNLSEVTPTRRDPIHPTLSPNVTGPLLSSSNFGVNYSTYEETKSPGLAGRIVQYNEEVERRQRERSRTPTHQARYGSPGLFPVVHLFKTKPPVLEQKPKRISVKVSTSPEYLRNSEYNRKLLEGIVKPNNSPTTRSYDLSNGEPSTSTRSVLDALKEISRKRIHASEEYDLNEDTGKRPKTDLINGGVDSMKRQRDDSPLLDSIPSPSKPTSKKLCMYDEYAASCSSTDFSFQKRQDFSSKRKSVSTSTGTESEKETKQVKLINAETQTITSEPTPKVTQEELEEDIGKEKSVDKSPSKCDPVLKVFDDAPLERIRKNRLAALMGSLTGKEPVLLPKPTMSSVLDGDKDKKEETVEKTPVKNEETPMKSPEKPLVSILAKPTRRSLEKSDKHVTFNISESESSTKGSSFIVNKDVTEIPAPPSSPVSLNPPSKNRSFENDTAVTTSTTAEPSGFSFGSSVAKNVSLVKPSTATSFSFGPSTATTSAENSVVKTPVSTISFGTSANTSVSSMSFGMSAPNTPLSTVSFGTSAPNPSVTTVSFGTSAPNTSVTTVSFGTSPAKSSVGTFSFGTPATNTTVNTLSFGTSTANTSINTMSFGTSAANASINTASYGTSVTSSPINTVSFGIPTTITSTVPFLTPTSNTVSVSSSFSFGTLTKNSTSTVPAAATTMPVLSFATTPKNVNFDTKITTLPPVVSTVSSATSSVTAAAFKFNAGNNKTASPKFNFGSNTAPTSTTNSFNNFAFTKSITSTAPTSSFAFGQNSNSTFKTPPTTTSFVASSNFNNFGTTSSATFPTATTTAFAVPVTTSTTASNFGTAVPMFGRTTTAAAAAATSAFGNTKPSFTPGFGQNAVTTTQSTFGTAFGVATTTTSSNMFGVTTVTTTASGFGNTPSIFNGTTTSGFGSSSIFGTTTTTTAATVTPFGNAPVPTTTAASSFNAPVFTFGTKTTTATNFGNSNIFNTTTASGNIFGATTQSFSNSTFGNQNFEKSNVFGGSDFGSGTTQEFGNNTNTPTFGANNQGFGTVNPKPATFGNPAPTFGSNQPNVNFGSNSSNNNNPSNFGPGASNPNTFGNTNVNFGNNSAFSKPPPSNFSNNFGNSAFQTTSSTTNQTPVFNFGAAANRKPPGVFSFGSNEVPKPSFNFTAGNPAPTFGAGTSGGFGNNPTPAFGSEMQTPTMFSIGTGSPSTNRARQHMKGKRRT